MKIREVTERLGEMKELTDKLAAARKEAIESALKKDAALVEVRANVEAVAKIQTEIAVLRYSKGVKGTLQSLTDEQKAQMLEIPGLSYNQLFVGNTSGLEFARGGRFFMPKSEEPPGDAGMIPPGAIHFINIELEQFLPLYKDITGAEVDTSPMGKLPPIVVRFTNTNAITNPEAIELLNRMLYEQAGIIATNTGPNRIQFRPRGRS